jgi:hypothetical protein
MFILGSNNEMLQGISKHWFETVSEKLRKGNKHNIIVFNSFFY